MVHCSVFGCKSRSERREESITFHSFPTNEHYLRLWTLACGKDEWKPTKNTKICSKHFSNKCMIYHGNRKFLKPNSLPTIDICVKNDIENYLKHKWVGGRVKLRNGSIPHKFECQNQLDQTTKKALRQSQKKKKKVVTKRPLFEEITTQTLDSDQNNGPYVECSIEQSKTETEEVMKNIPTYECKENYSTDCQETGDSIRLSFPPESSDRRSHEDNMIEAAHDVSSIKEEYYSECRACLQKIYTDSTFYNIFDCWDQQDGMDTTIADNLSKIANIHISESDVFPKVICDICCSLLQSAYTFAANVRKADVLLRNRIDNGEHQGVSEKIWPKPIQIDRNVENTVYNSDMEIKREVPSDEEFANDISQEQDFPELDIKIEPEELQRQHIPEKVLVNGIHDDYNIEANNLTNGTAFLEERIHSPVKEEPASDADTECSETELSLECMLCTKILNSVTGLKAHVIAQHSYKGVKRKVGNMVSPEKNKRKYNCTTCGRNFLTSTDLMVHETCHNKSVCYSCNESFDTFAQLTEHRTGCRAAAGTETRLRTLEEAKRNGKAKRKRKKIRDETRGRPRYKNYTEDMLDRAVETVAGGRATSRQAERQFGIPRRTILNKLKKRQQRRAKCAEIN